jgi:hypothetical protein
MSKTNTEINASESNPALAKLENLKSKDLRGYIGELSQAKDANEMLQLSLQMNLAVIDSIGNAPEMAISAYDKIETALEKALRYASDDETRDELQHRAATMVYSMIDFQYAKILKAQDANSVSSHERKKKATQKLAQELALLLVASAVAGPAGAVVGGSAMVLAKSPTARSVCKRLMKSIALDASKGGGLVGDWLDGRFSEEQLEQRELNFQVCLVKLFHKIEMRQNLWGNQSLIGNMIFNYAEQASRLPETYKIRTIRKIAPGFPLEKHPPRFQDEDTVPRVVSKVIGTVCLLAFALMLLNQLVGDSVVRGLATTSLFESVFRLHFWLLELPQFSLMFLFAVISFWLFRKAKNYRSRNKQEREKFDINHQISYAHIHYADLSKQFRQPSRYEAIEVFYEN